MFQSARRRRVLLKDVSINPREACITYVTAKMWMYPFMATIVPFRSTLRMKALVHTGYLQWVLVVVAILVLSQVAVATSVPMSLRTTRGTLGPYYQYTEDELHRYLNMDRQPA